MITKKQNKGVWISNFMRAEFVLHLYAAKCENSFVDQKAYESFSFLDVAAFWKSIFSLYILDFSF